MNVTQFTYLVCLAPLKRAAALLLALSMLSVTTGTLADPKHTAQPTVSFSQTIKGLEQAQLRSDGTLVAKGRVSGTGVINARHVIIKGVLSPGNSPGCITFTSPVVTFRSSGTILSELAGLTPCTEHDQIIVENTLNINSATLRIDLLNSYVPTFGDRFDILDWGSLIGTFGTIDASRAVLPAPLVWDTSQLYLTGELVVCMDVQRLDDGNLAPWDNPDSVINAADVLIAEQLVLGLRTPGALQYAHGDMNGDCIIDTADLLLITQAVLAL
jgi:hypothetical protein